MLGMLGLFGALLAGVMADSFIGGMMGKSDSVSADEPAPDAEEIEVNENGTDLLDWAIADPVADPPVAGLGDAPCDDPDYAVVSDDSPCVIDPNQVIGGGAQNDIMGGHGGDDSMAGGSGDDLMAGEAGADLMQGGSGADIGHGGAGADTLQGGAGHDLLQGDAGDDWLTGGAGDDTLLGHDGADHLYGSEGQDTLVGGSGHDRLDGGADADWLAGGAGADTLIGGAGSDTLDGGLGKDVLDGRDGPGAFPEMDFLNGGNGDDMLHLGAGDYATGGDGADWFELSEMTAGDAVANIADFDAVEDTLLVVFDPAMHPDPVLSFETPTNSDDVIVLLDGVALAMVQGGAGMTAGDVLMTPAMAA